MKLQRCDEDLGGVTLRQLLDLKPTAGPDQPLWLSDGSGIAIKSTRAGKTVVRLVDPADGTQRDLVTDMGSLPFLSSPLLSVSPDGRWIAYVGDSGAADGREQSSRVEIRLHPVGGGDSLQLTHINANINAYSWAPDGNSIVLSADRYGRYDVYRVSVPDGRTKRLTDDERYEVYPVYTADGAHIVYVRLNAAWTDHEIVVMTADGEFANIVAEDVDFFDYHYGRKFGYPLVRPAAKTVLFPSHRSGWINYWQVPLNGGEPLPVHAEASDQTDGVLAPGGEKFAFVANSNGATRLVVVDLAGGEARVLVNPAIGVVSKPAWSPDGKEIAFLWESPTCPADLWAVDVTSGATRQLTSSPPAEGLSDVLVAPEKVVYRSFDGLEISAYLYAPPDRAAGERYPALLHIHGGPTMQHLDTYAADVQYFVRKGYVVLMPNIRGSSGYGKAFEDANNQDWGHGDLRDVLAGVDFLKTLDYVDGNAMAIHGTSYGGCMSMSAVGFAPGVFKAAIPHAGYGDWLDFEDEQELRHRQLLRYEFGDVRTNRDIYLRCSPIYHLAQATTPVFLVHGEGRFPRSDASEKFARALEQEYKTYEYKIYPNECYYVFSAANQAEMYPDIVDFLDRYLKT